MRQNASPLLSIRPQFNPVPVHKYWDSSTALNYAKTADTPFLIHQLTIHSVIRSYKKCAYLKRHH